MQSMEKENVVQNVEKGMTVEQWLGDSQLGIDIWKNKYQHKGETFEQWLDRVSNGDEEVKQLILDKKFLFGGRILANRGLQKEGKKITYSNCYVVTPCEDNLESIYDAVAKLARTYSFGGGCGLDISKLAPKGAKVNNAAESTSGAVSFMDTFSQVTEQIGQQGRRGALMLSIDCTHPDLEEFIDVKTDLNKVNKANISVRVSDDFMDAVNNDTNFTLKFTRPESGEVIRKTIKAKQVFKRLAENNWNFAEPGCLFWDNINNNNLMSNNKNFAYAGTNPCLTGDTLINTEHGIVPIKDLVGKTPYVYCRDDKGNLVLRQASKVWMTRKNADIVKVITYKGEIKCTPDHKILTQNRGWVEAKDLKHGDKVVGLNRNLDDSGHYQIGLSGNKKYIAEHQFIIGAFNEIQKGYDVHHIDNNPLNNDIDNLTVIPHAEHSKITNLGHECYADRNPVDGRFINKKEHKKRPSCNLGQKVGTNWFVDRVEFLEEKEDVYDMTVPELHNFVANNIIVHNCAEEPLPAGGSCSLSSINLSAFVNENKEFDFEEFKRVVRIAVKAQNDILDEGLSLHPLKEQRDSVKTWRQIGIGIMGLADMLIKMEIEYDSIQAITLCDKIGKCMAQTAMEKSCELAKEKGCFEECTEEVRNGIIKTKFFENNHDEDNRQLAKDIKEYGLRNSQLLTIAPTGTLSTMLGISGGIEPIFEFSYTRKTESLKGHDEYYKVFTPIVDAYMKENKIKKEEDLPDFFVNAHTINYKDRIEMQSIWQKHIDASISSTVNLKEETTVDEVFDLYCLAWEKGLKGITIFRDNCKRVGILTKEGPKKETEEESGLKRGEVIPCKDNLIGLKRKLTTGCGSLHVQAYFDPETRDLQEVFVSRGSEGGCTISLTAMSRLISASCRAGVPLTVIADQLQSSGACASYVARRASKGDVSKGSSCASAVSFALIEMQKEFKSMQKVKEKNEAIVEKVKAKEEKDKDKEPVKTAQQWLDDGLCPLCHEPLKPKGGCMTCSCGFSKCD